MLAHVDDGKLTSKGVIVQILAEEHRRIREDGGDAKAYYAKSPGKGKGKQNRRKDKKCSHCERKGHDVSECYTLKREQEEKASKANSRSGTPSSGKSSGKSSSTKSSSGKALGSAKVARANASDNSSSDSDETVQVYMARTASIPSAPVEPTIERVYKTKAEISRSNLQNGWLINSGASRTMCSHRSWFTMYSPLPNQTKVILGDDSSIPAIGTGRVHVRMNAKGKWVTSILQNVLYVPDLSTNLLSVSHLARRSAEVRFVGEACYVYDKGKSLVLEGKLRNDLYVMQMRPDGPIMAKVVTVASNPENTFDPSAHVLTTRLTSSTGSLDLWHRRLGHLHHNAITRMADEELMTGMTISDREPRAQPCELCLEGKQTRGKIHKTTSTRSEHVLGRIFSDVCGPLPTQSY
jgi:hypothetical protein